MILMFALCADEDICKLYCIAEDFDFFFAMASKVKDGTSCSDHKGDLCIDGVCEVHCLFGFMVLTNSFMNKKDSSWKNMLFRLVSVLIS